MANSNAIYLSIDDIKGTVTASGHEGWIELESVSWGIDNGMTHHDALIGNTEESGEKVFEVHVNAMNVNKLLDKSTTELLRLLHTAKQCEATIHVCRTGQEQITTFLEYKLINCVVGSYDISLTENYGSENLILVFEKIDIKYTAQKDSQTYFGLDVSGLYKGY